MATDESNAGRWDRWYTGLDPAAPEPYGDTDTYRIGADWLADCALVEDWGCGKGWLTRFVPRDRYRGVDGSSTPFADVVADLANYRSSVPGVFMRHVLEHDYRWETILANAVASFTERMVLVLFTPLADETHEITFAEDPGVPDLSFRLDDITAHFDGLTVSHQTLPTATQYGTETIFLLERGGGS